jgi:Gas vesicle protein G
MFLLDSLMISGIQWALQTALTAAEAEMNDDSALRDRLLEAEMQREMGEISDAEFADIEADLLQAIREIKERREGGSGALAFGGAQPLETGGDSHFQIEAEVSGDFYGAPDTQAETDVITITPDAVAEVVLAPMHVSKRSTRSKPSTRAAAAAPPATTRRSRTTRTNRTARTNRAK